jgi:hypothetical protein
MSLAVSHGLGNDQELRSPEPRLSLPRGGSVTGEKLNAGVSKASDTHSVEFGI